MKSFSAVVAALTLILWGQSFPRVAPAHSLEIVEAELQSKEPNVEFVDQTEPTLPLTFLPKENVSQAIVDRKVRILNFADRDCQGDCASHMALISKLQKMVNTAHMIDQVHFITLITNVGIVDNSNTPFLYFAERFGLNPNNWTGLYANVEAPDAGNRLADPLGVMKESRGDKSEPELITYLVDREGQLRARFRGLEFQPVNLVSLANTLVYDVHGISTGKNAASLPSARLETHISEALVSGSVVVSGIMFSVFWYRRRRKSPK